MGGHSELWCLFAQVTVRSDGALLSWKCLNTCLLAGSTDRFPSFALLAQATIALSLSQPTHFLTFTLPLLSPNPLRAREQLWGVNLLTGASPHHLESFNLQALNLTREICTSFLPQCICASYSTEWKHGVLHIKYLALKSCNWFGSSETYSLSLLLSHTVMQGGIAEVLLVLPFFLLIFQMLLSAPCWFESSSRGHDWICHS